MWIIQVDLNAITCILISGRQRETWHKIEKDHVTEAERSSVTGRRNCTTVFEEAGSGHESRNIRNAFLDTTIGQKINSLLDPLAGA